MAHEWLDAIPDVKIVCNVDVNPDDLKIAQCFEAKMLDHWHANALEAEALLNRDRFETMPDKKWHKSKQWFFSIILNILSQLTLKWRLFCILPMSCFMLRK